MNTICDLSWFQNNMLKPIELLDGYKVTHVLVPNMYINPSIKSVFLEIQKQKIISGLAYPFVVACSVKDYPFNIYLGYESENKYIVGFNCSLI